MAPPATIERASIAVFGIPELAHLICPMIQRRDNVSLMRVCRQLFYSILPFVWEEVNEANVLMSLIPGAGIAPCDSEVLPHMVIRLPDSLELSRFNIYAPHVKRFTPSVLGTYTYYGWEGFLACTRSVDLLPNLEILSLPAPGNTGYTAHPTEIEVEWMNWMAAFLSSSVRSLVLSPSEAVGFSRHSHWLDIGLTHDFLQLVLQKCPGLSQLKLLHRVIKPRGLRPLRVKLSAQDVSPSYNSLETHLNLRHFNNLSSLLVTLAVLKPEAFAILSSLPKLESLSLFGYVTDSTVHFRNLRLPVDAFPALTNLELDGLMSDTIVNLCKAKPIVAKLQSITLSAHRRTSGFAGGLPGIVELLLANNSTITTLGVSGFSSGRVSPETLKSWTCLPLVTLHLGWSVIDSCGFDGLCSMLSCLPRLEGLELNKSCDFIEPSQLKKIVGLLPRLRRVGIPVDWELIVNLKVADFRACESQSDTALHVKSNFNLSVSEPRQDYAKQVARFLSTCRPSAPIVCESFQGPYIYKYFYSYEADEELKNLINLELSILRSNTAGMLLAVNVKGRID